MDIYKCDIEHNDRIILKNSNNKGFVKILCQKNTDIITGATIVCDNAGDMISEMTTCIQYNIGLAKLGNIIRCYLTASECIWLCAHKYRIKNWKINVNI